MPRSVLVLVLGNSTFARCGIIVNVTPWDRSGKGTSRVSFQTRRRCHRQIYDSHEGCAQVIFIEAD